MRIATLGSVLVLALLAESAAAQTPPPALLQAEPTSIANLPTFVRGHLDRLSRLPHTRRVLPVRVAPGLIRQSQFSLYWNAQNRLNLGSDGVRLQARRDRAQMLNDQEVAWNGRLFAPGDTNHVGYVTLIHRRDGAVYGDIRIGRERYELQHLGGGRHALRETDTQGYADEGPGGSGGSDTGFDTSSGPSFTEASSAEDPSVLPGRCAFDNQRVLVVYSDSASLWTSDQNGSASQLVNQANSAYGNSQIYGLNLVLAGVAQVNFEASGNIIASTNALRNNTYVQQLRNTHKADMVLGLLGGRQNAAGLALGLYPGEGGAYATALFDYAFNKYTFTHELGHLQGADHDEDNTGTNSKFPSYGYGHRWDADCNIFGLSCNHHHATVMAYTRRDGNDNFYTRHPYFSNPEVYIGAKRSGRSDHNNARVVRTTRSGVADYRDPNEFNTQVSIGGNNQSGEYLFSAAPCGNVSGSSTYAWQILDNSTYTFGPVVSTSSTLSVQLAVNESVYVKLTHTSNGEQRVAYASAFRPEPPPGCGEEFACSQGAPEMHSVRGESDELELRAVSPNPASGRFSVHYALPEAGSVAVEVFDVLGRSVLHRQHEAPLAGAGALVVETDGLPPGTYLVRLTQGRTARTTHIVVR